MSKQDEIATINKRNWERMVKEEDTWEVAGRGGDDRALRRPPLSTPSEAEKSKIRRVLEETMGLKCVA